MNFRKLFVMAGLVAFAATAFAQKTFDVNLYNGRVPYNNGNKNDTAKVRVYLPNDREATGRAVIICPGGGYNHLEIENEG